METRELYAKKYEAQLNEWRGKIDALTAHVQKSAAQAQLDLKPHLDGVSKHYEAAKTKLAHVAKATDDKWDGVKHDAEAAWNDLKNSVDGAMDALKKHGDHPPN